MIKNTIFHFFLRPPTFPYRISGQLIISTALAIIIAGAYPLYQFIESKYYNYQAAKIKENVLLPLKTKEGLLIKKQQKLKIENNDLIKRIDLLSQQIKHIGSYIAEAYKIKTSFKSVSVNLIYLTAILNKNSVKIVDLQKNNNELIFRL